MDSYKSLREKETMAYKKWFIKNGLTWKAQS